MHLRVLYIQTLLVCTYMLVIIHSHIDHPLLGLLLCLCLSSLILGEYWPKEKSYMVSKLYQILTWYQSSWRISLHIAIRDHSCFNTSTQIYRIHRYWERLEPKWTLPLHVEHRFGELTINLPMLGNSQNWGNFFLQTGNLKAQFVKLVMIISDPYI